MNSKHLVFLVFLAVLCCVGDASNSGLEYNDYLEAVDSGNFQASNEIFDYRQSRQRRELELETQRNLARRQTQKNFSLLVFAFCVFKVLLILLRLNSYE
jgi:hypothetical protein